MTLLPPDAEGEEIAVWSGRYVRLCVRGRWEYVKRTRAIGAVVILAIDRGHVLLVEQYRVPLGRYALELPAGLVGDEDAQEDFTLAAARELEEETGYRADRIEVIGEFASSPGLLGESYHLVRAEGLTRIGPGGGIADEAITVHRVPLGDAPAFIAARRGAGVAIDSRLTLLLGLMA